jgi:hypothetical protein
MQRLQSHTHPLAGLGLTLPEHIIFAKAYRDAAN